MLDILTELEAILEDLQACEVIGGSPLFDPVDRLEMVIGAIKEKEDVFAEDQ